MRRAFLLGLIATLGLTTAAQADFIYQGRFITLRINSARPVVSPAPATNLKVVSPPSGLPLEVSPPGDPVPPVGTPPQTLPPQPVPIQTLPTPTPTPTPSLTITPRPTVSVFTVQQFACAFKPSCGNHQVTLVHPITGCPVTVCFALPPGCPKVNVSRRMLEFDYGREEVEIHFERNGQVRVKYER